MKRNYRILALAALGLALALSSAYFDVRPFATSNAFAQDAGRRREPGFVLTAGLEREFTAGAAIAAKELVYLDSAAAVLKAPTSGERRSIIGIAPAACANAAANCRVQVQGVATGIADGTLAIGDRLGAPTGTAGRVAKITTGVDPDVVIGVALSAASAGGDVTILLGPPAKTGTAAAIVTLTNVDLDTTDNSIAAHVCEDQAVTATGVATTDALLWTMTTTNLAVTFSIGAIVPSATDQVTIRTCNNSAGAVDPGAAADFKIIRIAQ
jgi:hypothetical protein